MSRFVRFIKFTTKNLLVPYEGLPTQSLSEIDNHHPLHIWRLDLLELYAEYVAEKITKGMRRVKEMEAFLK